MKKLYAVLEQIKIDYKARVVKPRKKKQSDIDKVSKLIEDGAFKISNFEEFMAEFEKAVKIARFLVVNKYQQNLN
ncbi:MAG: hypothetical protein HC817_03780 [Saprospiraceae bacterium]|nr:hypothetical protein [Saprospiraceae bacterium]